MPTSTWRPSPIASSPPSAAPAGSATAFWQNSSAPFSAAVAGTGNAPRAAPCASDLHGRLLREIGQLDRCDLEQARSGLEHAQRILARVLPAEHPRRQTVEKDLASMRDAIEASGK